MNTAINKSAVVARSSNVTTTSANVLSNSILRRWLSGKTLYLSNLSYGTNEQSLEALASKYGKVASIRMPRDFEGRSRGFGFVEFCEESDAEKALEGLQGVELEGRELRVAEATGSKGGGGGFNRPPREDFEEYDRGSYGRRGGDFGGQKVADDKTFESELAGGQSGEELPWFVDR
ncbi:8929_t:CDS:2 [Entrophospora sp. SA101]|nr:8898_t:CDS:2 [Entrophospora sp. SA101]CAJ0882827.1 8929_t:CDS:2 [Entrophospora sp. SA101]